MTASGKFLCLITLGVGFGAVNTGNNLLFLLLGMLLALILASGILSEAVISQVVARRRIPQRCVAGSGAQGGYVVVNPKRFASLSIEVGDRNALALAGPAAGRVVGPPVIPWWKVWKKAPTEPPVANTYALRLDAESESPLDARFTFDVRGRYRLETLRVSTRFPFGFFEKSRTVDDPAEITVFPVGAEASDWIASVAGRFGEVPTNRRGRGDEFYGLRDYRQGEDRRQIHWKTTARRGTPVVRENEGLTQREVEVVFCDWSSRPVSPADFEHGVSKTAGLLTALAQQGWRVGLQTREGRVPAAAGAAHVDTMLALLAVVQPHRARFEVEPATQTARIVVGSRHGAGEIADAAATLTFEERADA